VMRGTTTVCAAVTAGTGCVDGNLTPGTAYGYAVTSRLQSYQSTVASVSAKVQGISSLVSQGIHSPKDLALAVFGAVDGIVAFNR